MSITALDAGMCQGEMALHFGDIEWKLQLIVLRGEIRTRARAVPVSTARLRAVLEWLLLEAGGGRAASENGRSVNWDTRLI